MLYNIFMNIYKVILPLVSLQIIIYFTHSLASEPIAQKMNLTPLAQSAIFFS